MIEAIYILMSQHDPRVLDIIGDEQAVRRAVWDLTGKINFKDIPVLFDAITKQMTLVGEAAKDEGLVDDDKSKVGELPGSST